MASFSLPNVEGMSSMDELKNAVGKMAKELTWLMQNLDWKNINELNIQLNGGAAVTINDEGITITDGTDVTFQADIDGKVTMTGATIKSSDEYPRVEMNPDDNLFGAYATAASYLLINALGAGGSPQLISSNGLANITMFLLGTIAHLSTTGADLYLESGKDIIISPGVGASYYAKTPFSKLWDTDTNQTLQTKLSGKASAGVSTSLSGSANGGIPIGTQLAVNGGGFVTWTGIPTHSHTQN